jgi:hypothetical protein
VDAVGWQGVDERPRSPIWRIRFSPLLDADEDDVFVLGEHRDELASLLPLLGLERFDRRACNKALAACVAPTTEGGMKISVQVIVHPDDDAENSAVVSEVFALHRDGLAPDTLGPHLAEAKDLRVAVQDSLVEHQVNAAITQQAPCPHCGKPRRHAVKPHGPQLLSVEPRNRPATGNHGLPGHRYAAVRGGPGHASGTMELR